jgi:hypothetical protein
MKKILIAFFIFTSFYSLKAQSKLIGYFNKLPKAHKHEFVITKNTNTYTANAGTGAVKVLLDEANGFMQIKDNGTGGGTLVYEMAIFKTQKGKDIVAVNHYAYEEGGMHSGGNIVFFNASNMKDITKEVLPDLTVVQDETYKTVNASDLETYSNSPYIYFELPKKGTVVTFNYSTNTLDAACRDGDKKAIAIKNNIKPALLFWHKDNSEVVYLKLNKNE